MNLATTIDELREYDTCLLANTIEYIDPTPAHEYYMAGYIQSVTPSLGPSVGVAVTCEMDSSTPGGNQPHMDDYWRQLEQMSAMKVPSIWVVKTVGSRPDHECVIGDGMAKTLYAAGCVALVADGGVRDIGGLLSTPFAAYCRGRTVHHTCLRIRSVGQPVEVGGITVRPGDVVHANAEGVIRIPQGCLDKLPASASRMRAVEHEVHRVWRRTDVSLQDKRRHAREVFAQHGFTATGAGHAHELQVGAAARR